MHFTLEDSTTDKVSPLLEAIAKRIATQSKTSDSVQKNLMYVLIIIAMIENGFIISDAEDRVTDPFLLDMDLLKKWTAISGTLEINLILCGFHSIPLKVLISPLGSTVLVNLVINDFDLETYTVCVPVSRYVVSPQASTIPMIFRDLRNLSLTLKNKVISAVKSRILSYHGYASASLIGLPEEVLYNIMIFLPVTDIGNVGKTCKRLNYLMNKEVLWHDLFKRDFGEYPESDSWKILYRDKYLAIVDDTQREAHRQAGTMHDFMDYSDLVSYVDNPLWGVIL